MYMVRDMDSSVSCRMPIGLTCTGTGRSIVDALPKLMAGVILSQFGGNRMMESEISVVIATRNRVRALEMSLPLILAQSLPPKEVIIVDSSDDPGSVSNLVADLSSRTEIPLIYVSSDPGLTKQRNIGLDRVTAPIVIFPDDDSLLYETCLEEVVRVYEADEDKALVGVTVEAAQTSPLSSPRVDLPTTGYKRKSSGWIMNRLGRFYIWIERRLAPIPYTYLRADILRGRSLPEPVSRLGCRPVVTQEGFRMSFRTEALRTAPFNEHLTGYSLGEDRDVCYGLSHAGMFACLRNPLIYHHEFPGARVDGYRGGVMQIVNLAYIVARHTEPGVKARKAFFPWIRLLILQTLLRTGSAYQRDRLRGVLAARRLLRQLLEAPKEEADAAYLSIMAELESSGRVGAA